MGTSVLKWKYDYLWWQKEGLMFTASGYGSKIPTTRKVLYKNRWRRVYCSIFSNSGVCFIRNNGQDMYISESNFGEQVR